MSENSKQRPTKKQREMLTFIENFITGHGYGPSYREIRAGMGYNSVATVAKHVDNLISRGHLRKKDNSARSLELVNSAKEEVAIRGVAPSKSQEKWFVDKVSEKFDIAEEANPLDQTVIDELKILIEATKILEIDGAHTTFIKRLSELKKKQ